MFGNPGIIAGWINIFFCIALLKWFQREARVSAPSVRGDRHVLRYSRGLRFSVVGYAILVTVLLAYCFLALSLLGGPYSIKPMPLFVGIAFITVLLFTPLLIHVFRTRIEYDSNFVYTFTPWRENRTISWDGFGGYSFNRVMWHHVFGVKGGDELRFGVLLLGYEGFLNEARKHGIPGLGEN